MNNYLSVLQSVLDGVPWSPEKADAAGFPSIHAARSRVLGSTHFIDDTEEQWQELETRFEQALEEIRKAWGDPDFHDSGQADLLWEGGQPQIERLAYWQRGDRIAYIKLDLHDNTRIRMFSLGERALSELKRR